MAEPIVRRLQALQFDLVSIASHPTSIIVWPDKPTVLVRPADHRKHWLDVRAGDEVYLSKQLCEVAAVRVFQGEPDTGETPVVKSGRDWLRRGESR